MHEAKTPDWKPFDGIRSLIALTKLAVEEAMAAWDTAQANAINTPEDEL